MSLNIYLTVDYQIKKPASSGIFVREGGTTKEISREEWNKRNPNHEPTVWLPATEVQETNQVYSDNITHNMSEMANRARLYGVLWEPDNRHYKFAKDIIPTLEKGLARLKEKPDYFKKFNPDNDWGSYELLVEFVENYLKACIKYPEAKIEVSR